MWIQNEFKFQYWKVSTSSISNIDGHFLRIKVVCGLIVVSLITSLCAVKVSREIGLFQSKLHKSIARFCKLAAEFYNSKREIRLSTSSRNLHMPTWGRLLGQFISLPFMPPLSRMVVVVMVETTLLLSLKLRFIIGL